MPACWCRSRPCRAASQTYVSGINNNNIVVGDYASADGAIHGFFGTLDGHYTTFDAPAGQTFAEAINDAGYITGLSNVPNDERPLEGCAFVRNPDGTITTITKAGQPVDGQAQSITDKAKFVGEYWDIDDQGNVFDKGFYGKRERYRADLTLPFETVATRPRGYNRHGEVVGYFRLPGGNNYPGFVLKDGIATQVQFPNQNAYRTMLESVNDKGQIAGAWNDIDVVTGQAFTYDFAANTFTLIDVPGSQLAQARGINNVGLVTIQSDVGPFLYCPQKRVCPISANAVGVMEKHITPIAMRSAVCSHACIGSVRLPTARNSRKVLILREWLKRDPELQRELRLPFRP